MARSWRDCEGREWHPRVTLAGVREIEARLGVSLFEGLEPGEMRRLLFGSARALAAGIWASVMHEAKSRGVPEEEVLAAIRGPALTDAIAGYAEALAEFWPEAREDAAT